MPDMATSRAHSVRANLPQPHQHPLEYAAMQLSNTADKTIRFISPVIKTLPIFRNTTHVV